MKTNRNGGKLVNRSDQARLRIVRNHALRLFMIAAASVIMALNIKSFVNAGGLFPGGFTGLTLLIQRGAEQFWELTLPFSLINFLLTDLIPPMPITDDVLLICIFGGLINGFAISLCLLGGATSGGTDFIAVAVSEKRGVDAWNYILFGNAAMLVVAGFLFGWDKALYSILFQYASTQIVHLLNPRYKRTTLFIISDKSEEIYEQIKDATHHGATLFQGTGLWGGQPRSMIYSVIAGDQVKKITRKVRQIDPHAFINILKTDQVSGNFYQQPHD